ncbi:DUF3631 domain-containing protein [Actinomadura sp. HBU206391]|uniref:DUF3631 domain-containing protein n=1 Tax=Actinomadura sp. HBU206391 TaxID=2731692 RepID=UPI00164FC841|nr:DUF3631 domain-containing protein [Actinomadura sp. HBU206391]MBC6458447.1 DUF3631 domain-containing protein [Actinomadura sp. HBU206391]
MPVQGPEDETRGNVVVLHKTEPASESVEHGVPDDEVRTRDGVLAVPESEAVEPLEGVVVEFEERELPALLPVWATSRAGIEAYIEWRTRWAKHMLAFHAIRSPKYTVRIVVRGVVGTARGVAALLGWVFDWEARPLRRAAIAQQDPATYLALLAHRNERVRIRGAITGGTTLVTAGIMAVEAAMFPPALLVEGVMALGVAAWWGGPAEEHGVLDAPDLPIQLDLSAEDLNEAFRAVGLLKGKDEDENAPRLVMVQRPMRDTLTSWAAVIDLPRGSGKSAKDVLAKRDQLAAELGVDEIQLDLRRVRAARGGHAGRLSVWVSDDDPYLDDPHPSPLEELESFDIWKPVPLGRDARGNPVRALFLWQSAFYGGLMRRGKTAGQRLPVSAGVLDPSVKHYLADGKGGSDWRPIGLVAHRYVVGAEEEDIYGLEAMLDEAIDDMEAAYAKLRKIPMMSQPDAKLTPEICQRYGLQITMVTIDELQEYLTAISDQKRKDRLIDRLCRIARRGPAAGFICNFASQRPDADSVPTRLRDIVSIRFCTQVVDRASSDMVLGKGRAAQGADASILAEEHKGVGVLSLGADNHVIVKHDYLNLPAFMRICERGRTLRAAAGTLTGDAADEALTAAVLGTIPQVLSDALNLMRSADKMHTTDLLNRLVNYDEDSYGDWSPERLAEELAMAGVQRSTTQVKIKGVNRNGYHKSDLMTAADSFERPS